MSGKNLVADLQNVAQAICKTALNTKSVDAFRTEALFTES